MSEPIFRLRDRVYHWQFGVGEVGHIDKECAYPIEVVFDDRKDDGCHLYENFTPDGRFVKGEQPTLSFTPYDLINGGFSQVRPEPELKEGQTVFGWGGDPRAETTVIGVYQGRTRNGKYLISEQVWENCGVLNPMPDSIEAKAIDIIRMIEKYSCVNGNDFGIEDFLKEIDGDE